MPAFKVILVISLLVLSAGFLILCYRMHKSGIPRPPGIPFFFLFGSLGGGLLLGVLPLSFLSVFVVLFFLLPAILIDLISSGYLAFRPERTVYHRVAMWGGFAMPILLPAVYLAGHAALWGPYEPTDRATLEQEFRSEFGFTPPAAVTDIRSRITVVGDTWTKWMAFTLDEDTLQRIVRQGFSESNPGLHGGGSWVNAPAWWKPPALNAGPGGLTPRIFHKEGHRKDFGGSAFFLWVDEKGRRVYSQSTAWD